MVLFWRIRYLDSRDRMFKDRDLWLETDTLDPVTRTAVEHCAQHKDSGRQRNWFRYRRLFRETPLSSIDLKALCEKHGELGSAFVHDYFEDENGQELSPKRMAEILTGNPNAIMFPAVAKQHDLDYDLSDKRPISIDQVAVSADDLRILGYFARNLREMLASTFYKEGPGSLHAAGDAPPELQTAVADEEIRSFVTIFRRLYMTGELAGFLKAVEVFARVTQGYPLAQWIAGVGTEYEQELKDTPQLVPYVGQGKFPFSRKRLIDVFLYTRYAHQPGDDRERQYQECLGAVGGIQALLTWLFLFTMWECSLHMRNAGVIIADFFDCYCQVHGAACDVLMSVARENPGVGRLEKKADRERRLFDESVKRLAVRLWEEAGRPAEGAGCFQTAAWQKLRRALGHDDPVNTGS